jgi:hypothetical protein
MRSLWRCCKQATVEEGLYKAIHGNLGSTRITPKCRTDTEFVHLLNHTADVVADDFAQHFVDHGHVRFAANVIAELGLDHRERGLHVAPLVVVTQEFFPVELEVVIHLAP